MRLRCLAALLVGTWIGAAAPVSAALRLEDVGGQMTIGYGKLFDTDAPKGSLSFGAGVDIPARAGLRAGVGFGYHLLGSRTLVQGSLSTGLDYSLIETVAQVHWAPGRHEPQVTLSGGPGLFIARADLGSSAIGASFSQYAIEDTRLGFALGATVMKRQSAPVRLGLEAAVRFVPLDGTTWKLATLRAAFRY